MIKTVAFFSGLVQAGWPAAIFAEGAPRLLDEMGVGAAILLTVLGMALHWRLPQQQMAMEERIKDGKITETEARRELQFYARCAPLATLMGVAVLVFVLFDLSQ